MLAVYGIQELNNAKNFGPNVDWKNGQNKKCIKK